MLVGTAPARSSVKFANASPNKMSHAADSCPPLVGSMTMRPTPLEEAVTWPMVPPVMKVAPAPLVVTVTVSYEPLATSVLALHCIMQPVTPLIKEGITQLLVSS